MRRRALALGLGLALAAALPARAQQPGGPPMASALGTPLADGSLPVGTVTVRIMRADAAASATDLEVTLTVAGGAPRSAKTGAEGRARFDGLTPGTEYTAEATVDGEALRSQAFRVPEQGGLRLLLAPTKALSPHAGNQGAPPDGAAAPAAPAAPAGPMMGGDGAPQGMPDPRQMSGMPRPEPNDPGGAVTVRVIQGSIVMNAAAGTPVHLVVVRADGTATVETKPLGNDGRARWDRLVTDGSAAYYALAVLARAGGEDRLVSQVISPPPQVGIRVMLAGLKADSTEPVVDDLIGEEGGPAPPPGTVTVAVRGDTHGVKEVELVELHQPAQARKAPVTPEEGGVGARFADIPSGGDKVYMAVVHVVDDNKRDREYRSPPLQLTAARGADTIVIVAPVLFGFHMGAEVDDQNLWFEAQFTLFNPTGTPQAPPGGLVIPLPRGFVGATVQEDPRVRVGDHGFIWRGAVPPGEHEFIGQFAVPVDNGDVHFRMPMPLGLFSGQIVVAQSPGLQVEVPERARQEVREAKGRAFVVVTKLTTQPGEELVLSMSGLPQHPGWERYAPIAVGLLVLGLLGWGAWSLASRPARGGGDPEQIGALRRREAEARRERLYDQLVQLTRRHRAGTVTQARYAREGSNLVKQLERTHLELRQFDDADRALAAELARGRAPAAKPG